MKANELKSVLSKINKLGIKKDPVVACTYIRIHNGEMTAFSDLNNIGYSYKCEEFNEIENMLIEFEYLHKLSTKFKKDWDILFKNNGDKFTITTNKGNFQIDKENIDWNFDFKPVEFLGSISARNIELIKKAVTYTADDELRPVMNCVFLDRSMNENKIVASDAHKLCFYNADELPPLAHHGSDNENLLIPKRAVSLMENTEYSISVPTSEHHQSNWYYYFNSGNETIFFRKEDGNFPSWRAVIPEDSNKILTISNVNDLKEKLDMAMIVNSTNYKTFLDLSETQQTLSTQDIDNRREYTAEISGSFKGDSISIGVNTKFLSSILNVEKYSSCDIAMSEEYRAIIINDEVLLMPMMRN